jgi:hypothetical protein
MQARITIIAKPAVHGFREDVLGGCAMGVLFKKSDIHCWTGPVFGCLFQCAGKEGQPFLPLTIFLAVLTRVPGEIPVPSEARCRNSNGDEKWY